MPSKNKKTWGLALSGSGNRTSFYIGFMEVLTENALKPDYISACSGGSLVAATYACGTLSEFKKFALNLNDEKIKSLLQRGGGGGFYSLALVEEEMRGFTKGLNFEDVKPLMSFSCVDVENGEKVLMQIGDLARAACVSCTLPGIFEPMVWGGRTLVDGGLLTIIPTEGAKNANVDVIIGISLRGTKNIFTPGQLGIKKAINFFKKILFLDDIFHLFDWVTAFLPENGNGEKKPGFFSVLGKSMDIALAAQKLNPDEPPCDLLIQPSITTIKRGEFSNKSVLKFYKLGRQCAFDNIDNIKKLIN